MVSITSAQRNLEACCALRLVLAACICLQAVTIQTVACTTLVNIGSSLAISDRLGLAMVPWGSSLVIAFVIFRGFKRIKRIDKFEKGIRGGS